MGERDPLLPVLHSYASISQWHTTDDLFNSLLILSLFSFRNATLQYWVEDWCFNLFVFVYSTCSYTEWIILCLNICVVCFLWKMFGSGNNSHLHSFSFLFLPKIILRYSIGPYVIYSRGNDKTWFCKSTGYLSLFNAVLSHIKICSYWASGSVR